MAKPINEFGGWLRFFQISNIISLIIFPFLLILMFIEIFIDFNYKQAIEFSIVIIDLVITMYFIIKILGIVQKNDSEVPERIIYYLKMIMIFSLIFLIFEIPATLWANNGEWTNDDSASVRGSLQSIITFLIWRSYFRKSKRVNLYYQNKKLSINNSDTTDNT